MRKQAVVVACLALFVSHLVYAIEVPSWLTRWSWPSDSQPDPQQAKLTEDLARVVSPSVIEDNTRFRDFVVWSSTVTELYNNMIALATLVETSGQTIAPPEVAWRQIFETRILQQLYPRESAIVAVVGGNNVGKSSVVNHVAGQPVSEVIHRGGATKQTVIIMAEDSTDPRMFPTLFKGAELVEGGNAHQATVESPGVHRVFWKRVKGVRGRVMVMDTPDFDSDNEQNWAKSLYSSQVADVIVAMISEEKYRNAINLKFFKRLNEEGKPVIVVVNKATPHQITKGKWKDWVAEFCKETGIKPLKVFVAPLDEELAEKGEMRFLEASGDVSSVANLSLGTEYKSLREEINSIRVDVLRTRAERGALQYAIEDEKGGILAMLKMVEERAQRYRSFEQLLSERTSANMWPDVPNQMIMGTIGDWVVKKRSYPAQLVTGMMKFVEIVPRLLAMAAAKPVGPPQWKVDYDRQEEQAVSAIVSSFAGGLGPLLEGSRDLITPETRSLLAPNKVTALITKIQEEQLRNRDVQAEFDRLVSSQIDTWAKTHHVAASTLQVGDFFANAIVRPAVSVSLSLGTVLLTTGAATIPAAISIAMKDVVSQGATNVAATSTGTNLYDRVANMGGSAVMGTLVSDLMLVYSAEQMKVVNQAMSRYFSSLGLEIKSGAALDSTKEFKRVKDCVGELQTWYQQWR